MRNIAVRRTEKHLASVVSDRRNNQSLQGKFKALTFSITSMNMYCQGHCYAICTILDKVSSWISMSSCLTTRNVTIHLSYIRLM